MPQLIAGAEARGPLNALWIAITAAGLWRLCDALGASARTCWAAVALYASLPLTAGLAAGMQTETPAAALLVWAAWLIVQRVHSPRSHPLLAGAVLLGGLIGLKLMGVVYAAIVFVWAAIARRPWPRYAALLIAMLLAAGVCLSSYVYAYVIAGNPFLPLFNSWFESPYFAASNFQDPRWQAGFSPLLPWLLTFRTSDYGEGMVGTAGFVLVALAGAWLLSFAQRSLRMAAVMATTILFATLLPIQYLRYAFPAIILLLAILVTAGEHADRRRSHWLFVAVAIFGFAFQANGVWMLRTGAVKQTVSALGRDKPLFEEYVPERILAEGLRHSGVRNRKILVLDGNAPMYAELGIVATTTAWYAPTMKRAADSADTDPSGRRWLALLRREGTTDVILRPATLKPAQVAGLRLAGAQRQDAVGEAEWWRIPVGAAP
jgi:hypothetical protein